MQTPPFWSKLYCVCGRLRAFAGVCARVRSVGAYQVSGAGISPDPRSQHRELKPMTRSGLQHAHGPRQGCTAKKSNTNEKKRDSGWHASAGGGPPILVELRYSLDRA
eukprot:2000710-Rhodomonas_salina.1